MPVRMRSARASFDSDASNGDVRPDNRLGCTDHAMFAQHRVIGRHVVIQVVWVYEYPVDLDGIRLFNRNLGYGLLGRRIEQSPLPFARHRWVSELGPSDIAIADRARPRAELSDWADECSHLPIDPELGPGWRLGVLPLSDGSTAVSLVLSHCLIDGFGLALTIVDAILGNARDLGYPQPGSRHRLRAVVQDARQTARDIPQLARALAAAARLERGRRRDAAQLPTPPPVSLPSSGSDDAVIVPVITIHVDRDDWEARAKALGGTSDTLVAGLAAKLGEHVGRRRDGDGAVTLQLPVSERTEDDTRALAVSYAHVSIDPTKVTTDLRDTRAAIKQALTTLREMPNKDERQVVWLTPVTPNRVLKRLADLVVADPNRPVFCSNLGDLGPMVFALARNDTEYANVSGALNALHLIRVIGQNVTRDWLERAGGQLALQSWRIDRKMSITVEAYQPGAENTKPALRELVARTLAEFNLTGQID